MLTPVEAEAAIRARVPAVPVESAPLLSLTGRVLQQAVIIERDQPPFDRVTMDGIAFASARAIAGQRSFRIAGIQAAGAPPQQLSDEQQCLEVMTGAVLPAGCDCVIPVEKLQVSEGVATLLADVQPAAWLNVHRRGLDSPAGRRVLEAGTVLGPAEVAVIASAGLPRVKAVASPRIMVISTGDELIEPGEPIEAWQIRRSNVYGICAALARRGYGPIAEDHLPDDLDILRSRLRTHLDTHDVLVLSGGVSMGKFDFVPQVLRELGVSMVFQHVAQKPGKPMWFGVHPAGKAVYALPGNPVSTMVCLRRYVIPGLQAAMGQIPTSAEKIALSAPHRLLPSLAMLLPVKLETSERGLRLARPSPTQGSGDFISLLGTDGFVELPPGQGQIEPGAVVALYRW